MASSRPLTRLLPFQPEVFDISQQTDVGTQTDIDLSNHMVVTDACDLLHGATSAALGVIADELDIAITRLPDVLSIDCTIAHENTSPDFDDSPTFDGHVIHDSLIDGAHYAETRLVYSSWLRLWRLRFFSHLLRFDDLAFNVQSTTGVFVMLRHLVRDYQEADEMQELFDEDVLGQDARYAVDDAVVQRDARRDVCRRRSCSCPPRSPSWLERAARGALSAERVLALNPTRFAHGSVDLLLPRMSPFSDISVSP